MDITLLQETLSLEENEHERTRDWEGGQVIFLHGTNHSRRCLITVNKNLDIKILNKVVDVNERYILLHTCRDKSILYPLCLFAKQC